MRSALAPTLVGALVSACTEAPPPQVEVRQAHARPSVPGAPNGAVFMTLVNSGGAGRVVGVRSPVSDVAELHTHLEEDGVMRMRKIPEIELPAQGEVRLEPGGLHIMLGIRLKAPLEVGDRVPVTLELAGGQRLEFEAPVRALMPPPTDAAASQPAHAPASKPASAPASRPSSAPASRPSSAPALPSPAPASAPARRGHSVAPDR